jgi:hypothetical protein
VSGFDPYAYLDAAAGALDLPIAPEQRESVAAQLARLELLARQVMSFDPTEDSAAPEPRR